jgi:hypothetical protein
MTQTPMSHDPEDRDRERERTIISPAGTTTTTHTAATETGTPHGDYVDRTYIRRSTVDTHPGAEPLEVEIPRAFNLTRDRIHWGPIWAGLLTAFATMLVLNLLGLATGLTTVNAGTAAAEGAPPADLGRNAALWAGLAGILAFLLGGYVASRASAVFNRGWGAMNGLMVAFLSVPLILFLASQGLGFVLGTLGSFAGAMNADPGTAANAAQSAANQAQAAAQNTSPVDVARTAEAARNAAWGTLAGLLAAFGASALGGLMGTRRTVDAEDLRAEAHRH